MHCIYLRKSRADAEAEARGEGETLARHEKILLDVAKKQQLNIGQIYKEIVSGETIASRPVMQQLLQEVEQGQWDGVVVVEIERLARGDTIDQGIMAQAFTLSGTKIITPTKTYDPTNEFDSEFFEFSLFMSRREYKAITRRMQRGKEQSVKEGNYNVSAPYGYRKIYIDGQPTLEPHPKESEVVKMIFSMYVNGYGTNAITTHLIQMNIPPKNKTWSRTTVRSLLKNITYTGKVNWSKRKVLKKALDGKVVKYRALCDDYIIAEGKHEAIISNELFEKAQIVSKNRLNHSLKTGYELRNPLAGILFCKDCGHSMARRINADGADAIRCINHNCSNSGAKMEIVENSVIESLDAFLSNCKIERLEEQIADESNILKQALLQTQEQINELNKQQGKIYELLEKEIYSTDVFLERNSKIKAELQELFNKDTEIKKRIENLDKEKSMKKEILPKIEKIINVYAECSCLDRNELLKAILHKIEYKRVKRGKVELWLYPKI